MAISFTYNRGCSYQENRSSENGVLGNYDTMQSELVENVTLRALGVTSGLPGTRTEFNGWGVSIAAVAVVSFLARIWAASAFFDGLGLFGQVVVVEPDDEEKDPLLT